MSPFPERSPAWLDPRHPAEQRMNYRLNGYWDALRGDEPYAPITAFNVEKIPGFGQHAFMLDLYTDPHDPMIRFAGQRLAIECGKNVAGQRLSGVPAGTLLARVARNFSQVVEDEAPCEFAEKLEQPNGDMVLYRGIMLPFSKDGTGIDYIVGAITSKTVNRDGETIECLSSPGDLGAAEHAGEGRETQDEHGARGLIALIESEVEGEDVDAAHRVQSGAPRQLRASLDECQSLARKISAAESRSRKALYDTLERVYSFYHEAAADPEGFETLVADAGLSIQERAPFTPIVKLVFGADHDKTRLCEYATALGYAKRKNQAATNFRSFIESQDGGLKGCIKAERAARRAERGAGPDATEEAHRLMREAQALGLVTEKHPGEREFVLLLGRRLTDRPGCIEVLSVFDEKPETLDRLLRRAAKQSRHAKTRVSHREEASESAENG